MSVALLTPTPSEHEPAAGGLRGSPLSSMLDVHVTLGLDKSGDPETVKRVATFINQPHPNSPSNIILVGVCPCLDETYHDMALDAGEPPSPVRRAAVGRSLGAWCASAGATAAG